MVKKALASCREDQLRRGSVIDGCVGVTYVRAARRIKGVVKPQQRPTMRKEST